jgi:hypothetical protein
VEQNTQVLKLRYRTCAQPYQEGSLLQKDNTSYWTDKQIDRGMKFVDAATKAVDTYTGVKYVNKPVKEKHNYKYDWKNRRWDHEFSVETTRSPKK